MLELLVLLGALIIAGLSFYAGKLLFQVKQQANKQHQARQKRIVNITESIRTIALAMEQQQCNLSEGVIRLTHLLDAMPVQPQPNYAQDFQSVYALHDKVKDFPTHEARNSLSKAERREQDKVREQLESEFESRVLKDIEKLKDFTV